MKLMTRLNESSRNHGTVALVVPCKTVRAANIATSHLCRNQVKSLSEKDNSAESTDDVRYGVRTVYVDADSDGQRIDNFVARALKGVPRSRIYRLLRKGEVRVNGRRVKQSARIVAGDKVRLPPVHIKKKDAAESPGLTAALLDRILFEDRRLLVINKPSGVAVHGGSGVSVGVIEALRGARPDLKDLGLVHRIDRETSGCLVLAKRRSALRALHTDFREGRVSKRYLAACCGDWPFGKRTVDAPLQTRTRRHGERFVVVSDQGKPAKTVFAPEAVYDGFSILSVEPLTGRTHQIRVHAASTGFPLAMDERYGDPEKNAALKRAGLKRLFLHAQSIAFADDAGNELLFTAPLADDLDAFLARSRKLQ